jgi:hypothetical protein
MTKSNTKSEKIRTKEDSWTSIVRSLLGYWFGMIFSLFKALGRAALAAYENTLRRWDIYVGMTAAAAVGYQIFLAFMTGGMSLLFAPLAVLIDVAVFTTIAFMADTLAQLAWSALKLVGTMLRSLFDWAVVSFAMLQIRRHFSAADAQSAKMHAVA